MQATQNAFKSFLSSELHNFVTHDFWVSWGEGILIIYKPKAERRLTDMPEVPNQEKNPDLVHSPIFFPLLPSITSDCNKDERTVNAQ